LDPDARLSVGKVKEKLTDDDLTAIAGQRDQSKVGCKSGTVTPRIKLAKTSTRGSRH